MIIWLYLIGTTFRSRMSRYLPWNRWKTCKNQDRKRHTNRFQDIIEHQAFRSGSIMMWAYIDLHIIRRVSVMADRYWNKVLEPTLRFYSAAVGPDFFCMDGNACSHSTVIVDNTWKVRGLRLWCGQHNYANIFLLKICGMSSAMLGLNFSHSQPCSQNFKLLYRRKDDYLNLGWLITTWKAWSHATNFIGK